MSQIPNLTVFTPVLACLAVLLTPSRSHRTIASVATFVTMILSGYLVFALDAGAPAEQFVVRLPWIEMFNVSYGLGIDGIGALLTLMSSLVFFLGCIKSGNITQGTKGYFSLFLLLESSVIGMFAANDLFLFFSFWMLSLVPVYFLLGIWGGEQKEYAATKAFVYQLLGSALILFAMLTTYHAVEPHSFLLDELAKTSLADKRIDLIGKSWSLENFVFVLFFIGFSTRLALFPLHSWFTHAISQAPTALAVVLGAVFIKTGAFAILRINYMLFPHAAEWFSSALAIIGVVNIIYGGVCALGQRDLKKLISYATISQMGVVMFGLAVFSSASIAGSVLLLLTHGIYTALLLFLVGFILQRMGKFDLLEEDDQVQMGGLIHRTPILAGFFIVAILSSFGIPGMGAFNGEALVFLGSFPKHQVLTLISLFGIVLMGAYLAAAFKRIFLGPLSKGLENVSDLSMKEKLFVIPLAILSILLGSYPKPLLSLAEPTILNLLNRVNPSAQSAGLPSSASVPTESKTEH